MRKFRKAVASVMALCAITCMETTSVFAADDTISVSLRIEGADSTFYYQTLTVDKNTTVEELIKQADNASSDIQVTMSAGYGGGYYVSGVNSLNEASFGGYDGWNYCVDGIIPDVGISSYELESGDKVVLYYADTITTGIQYPVEDTSDINDGIIKFTSTDTVYDANWNATTSVNPVAGATVTWYYGNSSATYTTDANGSITIDASQLTSGDHRLQIDKYSDNGLPVVLRYAQDHTVNVYIPVASGDKADISMYVCIALFSLAAFTGLTINKSNKEKAC